MKELIKLRKEAQRKQLEADIAEAERRIRDANQDLNTIPTPYVPYVPYTPPTPYYPDYPYITWTCGTGEVSCRSSNGRASAL